ncbi:MAG: hypothetical protein ACOCVA_00900 [Prolixibacteraceae bacterium]
MDTEFIEKMAPPLGKTRPTLRQIEYHRRFNRRNIEQEVLHLEEEFRQCNKMAAPGKWLQLQTELGEAYKKLMEMKGNER